MLSSSEWLLYHDTKLRAANADANKTQIEYTSRNVPINLTGSIFSIPNADDVIAQTNVTHWVMKKCVNAAATTIRGEGLPSGNSPFIYLTNLPSAIPSIKEYPAKEKPNVHAIIVFVSLAHFQLVSPNNVINSAIKNATIIYGDRTNAVTPPYVFQYNLYDCAVSRVPPFN